MTKILVIGDVHASDKAPAKRTDTYRGDILEKLREIVLISKEEKVDGLLFMGDIFDAKQPKQVSHKLVIDLLEILKETKAPCWIVCGNHDITEGRLESLYKQPLKVLGTHETITILEWEPLVLEDIVIYPIPGVPNVTVEDYYIKDFKEDKKWHIIASHQSVVPNKNEEMEILRNKPFIHDSQEIADITQAQIILYGHQHRHDGIYRRSNKLFSNLGSICRGTIGNEDLNKKPSVLVLELTDKVNAKIIQLKNVKPKEEVFHIEEHFEAKAHKEDIDEAIKRLQDTRLEKFSIETVINDIELREDVDQPVKDKAFKFIEAVR